MEIILSFAFFLLFFLGMSVSLLVKGKPIKGTCVNVAVLLGNESCEICGGNPDKCEEVQQTKSIKDLAYNAAAKEK